MAKRKIWLGPLDNGVNGPLYVEGLVVDAFTAGELLRRTSSGLATSNIGATAFNNEISEAEGGNITTPATVGDTGKAISVRSGEFVNASVGASENITSKGVALSAKGDGTLKIAVTDGSEQILFYSDEIINTGAAVALVQVRKA